MPTPSPTAKGAATRERMLDASIELMRASGLSGAGINDIVRASGAPKGSVYHFFPGGKEQVVSEALALYRQRVAAFIDAALHGAVTPEQQVRQLFEAFARRLEASQCSRSCAAGAVALDLDPAHAGLRAAVADAFADWIDLLAARLLLADPARARALAGLLLSGVEGAYVRGRAEASARAFREAGSVLADMLQGAAVASGAVQRADAGVRRRRAPTRASARSTAQSGE